MESSSRSSSKLSFNDLVAELDGSDSSVFRHWIKSYETAVAALKLDKTVLPILIRNRLVGSAKMWVETLPPEEQYDVDKILALLKSKMESPTRLLEWKHKLYSMSRTSESPLEYAQKIRNTALSIGGIEDNEIIALIIRGLKHDLASSLALHKFTSSKDLLETLERAQLYSPLGNAVNAFGGSRRGRGAGRARGRGRARGFGNRATSPKLDKDTCRLCKKKGHWAKDCPKKSGAPANQMVSDKVNALDYDEDEELICQLNKLDSQ